jgi:sec-independent protein translocase protein TatA
LKSKIANSYKEFFMNTMFAAFFGGWEMIVVLLAVLLLFGARKLPDLARGLGQGIREFKKATREITDEIQSASSTQAGKSRAVTSPDSASVISRNPLPTRD